MNVQITYWQNQKKRKNQQTTKQKKKKETERKETENFSVRSTFRQVSGKGIKIPVIFVQVQISRAWTNISGKTKFSKKTLKQQQKTEKQNNKKLHNFDHFNLSFSSIQCCLCMCKVSAEVRIFFQKLRHLYAGEWGMSQYFHTLHIKVHL